jgi:pyruvate ferredoxin oxidoreductase gamma subunit
MFQVRFHGRGGQGVGATAELLSLATSIEGRYAHPFPSVDADRPGAPVTAHCRLSEVPIRMREPVYRPDAVVLHDATLRYRGEVLAGLVSGGFVLINSLRDWEGLDLGQQGERLCRDRTAIVPATELALEHVGQPMAGLALLGGFAALTRQVTMEEVAGALYRRFPLRVAADAIEAARAAYAHVESQLRQPAGA